MVFRWLTVLCLFTRVAAADTAYVVHTSEGEFEKTASPCGDDTQDRMFNRLTRQPVVTVGDDFVRFTTQDRRDEAAHEAYIGVDATGIWTFNADQLIVSVRHWGFGDHGPKVLDVTVVRHRAASTCIEHWQGIVLPSRTRETLRGS